MHDTKPLQPDTMPTELKKLYDVARQTAKQREQRLHTSLLSHLHRKHHQSKPAPAEK